jgi:hypothetical protein
MDWEWIDRDAREGPIFRVGPDTYVRDRPDSRVVRLTTTYAPGIDYIQPSVDAFAACAEQLGAPLIFVLEPDVKKPPPVRFLFEWSKAAYDNGSVERSWFLMRGRLGAFVGNVVCRAFVAGGMPFEALGSRAELDRILDGLDLTCGREGFSVAAPETALAVRAGLGEGMYGQLFKRLVRRVRGQPRP